VFFLSGVPYSLSEREEGLNSIRKTPNIQLSKDKGSVRNGSAFIFGDIPHT
jgi:hypothetical protein